MADTINLSQGVSGDAYSPTHINSPQSHYGYPDVQSPALWQGVLSESDRDILEVESALSREVINARGYFTTTDKALLQGHGFAKNQCLTPVLVIPLWDWQGERAGVAIRHSIPRTDKNGKVVKYDLPPGSIPTLDVAPATRCLLTDLSRPLILTEGAKKADCAASLGFPSINLNGVWGFQSKGAPLPDWELLRPYLRERLVLVAYDSDVTSKHGVATAMRRLENLLKSLGAVVKVLYLEDGPDKSKTGLDDFIARGGTSEQLFALARDLEPLEESNRKRREQQKAGKRAHIEAQAKTAKAIVIETYNRQQRDELRDLGVALEQLNARQPRLFHGAPGLVRIGHSPEGKPTIKPATREAVRAIAGKAAHWICTSEHDVREVAPPRDLCAVFLESPDDWRGIPILQGTATAPFFAPDGTLCATTGYHEAASLWLELPKNFRLSDTTPTPENVQAARRLLLEDILGEVRFVDNASRAHAVAQMILPFVRNLIEGATPLHLWNAPLRGSGKSYGAELCILPFTEPTSTPEKASAEEWRKSLLCELVSGPSHIFLDNIKGSLNSPALDTAITSSHFRDRLTGTGEMVSAPVRCVWVATSNNAELTEDIVTRALVIQVDPNLENPEEREFARDPKRFVREHRGVVVGAIVTLVRAWQQAGIPSYSGPHRCRFPQWQNVLGGILEVAGIDGFLENMAEQRANIGGDAGSDWHEFTQMWQEKYEGAFVNAGELLSLALQIGELGEALDQCSGARAQEISLTKAIKKNRDRVFGGLKIKVGSKIRRKQVFRLELCEST